MKILTKTKIVIILTICLLSFSNNKAFSQCEGSSTQLTVAEGSNLSFSGSTPANFSGWTAKVGSYTSSSSSTPNFSWQQTYPDPTTATDGGGNRFLIITDTNSTDAKSNGQLKRVPTHLGYTRSARLGNQNGGGDCAQLSYNLMVTASNCLVTICYAMVLETPHQGSHFVNPTFEVDVVQPGTNTKVSDCLFFQMCGDISTSNLPTGWHIGMSGWAYCDWKQIKVNLLPYLNTQVEIRIRVSDCAYSAHGAYGYIACKVEKPTIEVAGCAGMGDTVTTVPGPDGFAQYKWFEIPFSTPDQDALDGMFSNDNIVSTDQTLVVTNAMIGTNSVKHYAVQLTSPTEHVSWNNNPAPACVAYIPVTVNDMRPNFDAMLINQYIEVDPLSDTNWVGFTFNDVQARTANYPMDWQLFEFGDSTDCSVVEFLRDSATNTWTLNTDTYPLDDRYVKITYTSSGVPDVIWHNYEAGDYVFTRTAHVHYWDEENCRLMECQRDASLDVHVPVRPCFELSARDTICVNDSVKISVVTCEGDSVQYDYSWFNVSDDINSATPFATGETFTINSLDKDTTIKVMGTNPDGGSYRIVTIDIAVQGFPNIEIEGDTMICMGENLDLRAGDTSGYTRALRWSYQRPTLTTSVGAGSNPAYFNEPVKQDTTLYILAQTTKGCFAWDSVNILVVIPQVHADTTSICPGDRIMLTGSGAVAYSWRSVPEDSNLPADTSDMPVTIGPDTTTVYTMTGFGQNGCSSDVNITIKVIDYPTATIGFNPPYVDLSNPILIITDSSETAATSIWTFSDGGTATGRTVTYTFSDLTVEQVEIHLQSENELGCATQADTTVPVVLFAVWLPTGFSPDNDGYNDYFFFMTENDLYDVVFEVYDRWGAKMYSYETKKYEYQGLSDVEQYGWNGTYNGKDAQNGSYVWRLSYKREGSTRVYDRTGTINLVR